MRKLKLDVDALKVTSFDAQARDAARGTVRALQTEYWELCPMPCSNSDPRLDTCQAGTCGCTGSGDTCGWPTC